MSAHPKCQAKKSNGQPCRMAPGASGFCFIHDPATAAARAAAQRAGGLAQKTPHSEGAQPPAQIRTVADVLALLDYATAEAAVMDNSVLRGRLLVQLATAYAAVITTGDIEARLAALEALRAKA